MTSLKGTGVALITPFDQIGDVDFIGLEKLLIHTAKGVDYYVVQGTTGESVTTTDVEKATILEFVIKHNPQKLPIVYGIGGNNTVHVIETIEKTNLDNVDAILSVSPYYNKPTQAGIIQHFVNIADTSPIPIILYNVPSRTGSNMTAETTIELSKHKNIIGIKEASGNVEQAMAINKNTTSDFLLISGDDLLTPTLISAGAVGVISVLANAFPLEFKEMFIKASKNDSSGMENALKNLIAMNPLMYEEGNPVGIKEVLRCMNICGNNVRLPLLPASNNLSKRIKALL